MSSPASIGFDFIVIVALLPFHCGFSFVLGCGVAFFGGFQCLPVDGCSTASCDFDALAGEDARTSFYSTIVNQFIYTLVNPSYIFPLPSFSLELGFPCPHSPWEGRSGQESRITSKTLSSKGLCVQVRPKLSRINTKCIFPR